MLLRASCQLSVQLLEMVRTFTERCSNSDQRTLQHWSHQRTNALYDSCRTNRGLVDGWGIYRTVSSDHYAVRPISTKPLFYASNDTCNVAVFQAAADSQQQRMERIMTNEECAPPGGSTEIKGVEW